MPNILVKGHMRFDSDECHDENIILNNINANKKNININKIDELYSNLLNNIDKIHTAQIKYIHQNNKKSRDNIKSNLKNAISYILLMAENLDYDLNELYCE